MPARPRTSRAHVWLDGLGDWSWPRTAPAAELHPPSWVPALPPALPRLTPAATSVGGRAERARRLRLFLGALLSALAALGVVVAVKGPGDLERLLGYPSASTLPTSVVVSPPQRELPVLSKLSSDSAGSYILSTSYSSPTLHGKGAFYVYLPPGYASTNAHYPVLYLLPGQEQSAKAFLQVGLQGKLDSLIEEHVVPPMIAVMIQGGPGSNNWRNRYERYAVEVQELVDEMLPTIPTRADRGIAGDSMGGYGAMSLALTHPESFSVAESWIGFFNGLSTQLRSDRPMIARLGLHAFVYGAEDDRIADPAEDAPFAAALRAAGASASSAIYPGEHSLETVEAHLASMLALAGRSFTLPSTHVLR